MPEKKEIIDALKINLQAFHFQPLMELGAGAFGEVILFQYTGDDPRVLALCNAAGEMAIKLSVTPDEQEKAIAQFFASLPAETRQALTRVNITSTNPCSENLGIICQYESYPEKREDAFVKSSSNLQNFLKNTFYPPYEHQKTSPEIAEAFTENLGVMMAQITSNISAAQGQLHHLNMLHLDTSARNFLVSNLVYDVNGKVINIELKISDFGLAKVLPPGQKTTSFVNIEKIPLKWTDHEGLYKKEASVKTDIFARKATTLGMLGFALQATTGSEAKFLPQINANDNQTRLRNYMASMTNLMYGCQDQSKREELGLYLRCYNRYLMYVPKTHDVKKAERRDNNLLLKANELYVISLYRKALENYNNPPQQNFTSSQEEKAFNEEHRARFLRTLQRLQGIPIEHKDLKRLLNQQVDMLISGSEKTMHISKHLSRQQEIDHIFVTLSNKKIQADLKDGFIDAGLLMGRLKKLQDILSSNGPGSQTEKQIKINTQLAQTEIKIKAKAENYIEELKQEIRSQWQPAFKVDKSSPFWAVYNEALLTLEDTGKEGVDLIMSGQVTRHANDLVQNKLIGARRRIDVAKLDAYMDELKQKMPQKWHAYLPVFEDYQALEDSPIMKTLKVTTPQEAAINNLGELYSAFRREIKEGEKSFETVKKLLDDEVDKVIQKSSKTTLLVKLGITSSTTAKSLQEFKKNLNEMKDSEKVEEHKSPHSGLN